MGERASRVLVAAVAVMAIVGAFIAGYSFAVGAPVRGIAGAIIVVTGTSALYFALREIVSRDDLRTSSYQLPPKPRQE